VPADRPGEEMSRREYSWRPEPDLL